MTTSALHIAVDHPLPLAVLVDAVAILARRGAGKTYTGAVLVEEAIEHHQPVVVLDPTGVWWGLRSSADGTKAGYPVVILGGEHGDVALEPTAGKVIADLVVDSPGAYVLDVSGFDSNAAQDRFAADFAERLYRRKAKDRAPLTFVVDEADSFAPQRPQPGQQRMLGAFEAIVRRGRSRGLGVVLISQRAAVVNKNVLTQCEILIALQTTGTQDRTAVLDWVKGRGTPEEVAELGSTLASLKVGEAWLWSPQLLACFTRVQVRRRRTFDSSATPKPGEAAASPTAYAPVDLDALGGAIAATIEKARADDPKVLRARVAELERQLAEQTAPEPVERLVEVPVLDDALAARLEQVLDELGKRGQEIADVAGDVRGELGRWKDGPHDRPDVPRARAAGAGPAAVGAGGSRTTERPHPPARREPGRAPVPGSAPTAGVGKGERVVLIAVAQHRDGVTREQLTVLTGYKRSTRDAYVQRLRQAELVDVTGTRIVATQAAFDMLGDDFEPLPTGAALREHWLATLPEGEGRILALLVDAYPAGVARDALTAASGYKRSTRDAYLQRLRARQLVTTDGEPRAADVLFDGAPGGRW